MFLRWEIPLYTHIVAASGLNRVLPEVNHVRLTKFPCPLFRRGASRSNFVLLKRYMDYTERIPYGMRRE